MERKILTTKKKKGSRAERVWGAWFFFRHYFEESGSEKEFMVQQDMENMYMWALKDRPENALGKMQLRSFMNGHSRPGEMPFPFPPEKGFLRSHRMQRKRYRGLSNPQCLHGIRPLPSPSLPPDLLPRWALLTGHHPTPPEANNAGAFSLPPHAGAFVSWRTPPPPDTSSNATNGNNNGFSLGPLTPSNLHGPVTAAKAIYEDDRAFLVLVSLPLVDLRRVRLSWRNTLTHALLKVSAVSTARAPFLRRRDKLFVLASSEHCPPGEFVREIPLSTTILEDAHIEAYYNAPGSVLEILVPKPHPHPQEHEIRVSFPNKTSTSLPLITQSIDLSTGQSNCREPYIYQ